MTANSAQTLGYTGRMKQNKFYPHECVSIRRVVDELWSKNLPLREQTGLIPADLYERLSHVLFHCYPFKENRTLRNTTLLFDIGHFLLAPNFEILSLRRLQLACSRPRCSRMLLTYDGSPGRTIASHKAWQTRALVDTFLPHRGGECPGGARSLLP